jgi:adenosyl cobinamide kinase/adenosyl cobinamide phosphate guanylyltransferase
MNTNIADVVERIMPLDREAMREARDRLDALTKPRGSLGRLEELAVQLAGITGLVISNEVGGGIVPADPLTRGYRDLLGEVNQRLAATADTVVLLVSGIPVDLRSMSMKGEANQ